MAPEIRATWKEHMFLKKVSCSPMEPSQAPCQPPVGIQSQCFSMAALFETLSSDSIQTSYSADSICTILGIVGLFLEQENCCFQPYFLWFHMQCNFESVSKKVQGSSTELYSMNKELKRPITEENLIIDYLS